MNNEKTFKTPADLLRSTVFEMDCEVPHGVIQADMGLRIRDYNCPSPRHSATQYRGSTVEVVKHLLSVIVNEIIDFTHGNTNLTRTGTAAIKFAVAPVMEIQQAPYEKEITRDDIHEIISSWMYAFHGKKPNKITFSVKGCCILWRQPWMAEYLTNTATVMGIPVGADPTIPDNLLCVVS